MLSDPFNNTLRELLAPKGVAECRFDPSSCLLVPQGGRLKTLVHQRYKIYVILALSDTLRELVSKNNDGHTG